MTEPGNGTRLLSEGWQQCHIGSNPIVSATKYCTSCLQEKYLSDFDIHPRGKLNRHPKCKQCRSTAFQKQFRTDADFRERLKNKRKNAIGCARIVVINYLKDKSCERCGNKDMRVLDFDHIDPSIKTKSISKMVAHGYGEQRILKEIEKCRILCANCHRIHTIEQMGYFNRNSVMSE